MTQMMSQPDYDWSERWQLNSEAVDDVAAYDSVIALAATLTINHCESGLMDSDEFREMVYNLALYIRDGPGERREGLKATLRPYWKNETIEFGLHVDPGQKAAADGRQDS